MNSTKRKERLISNNLMRRQAIFLKTIYEHFYEAENN